MSRQARGEIEIVDAAVSEAAIVDAIRGRWSVRGDVPVRRLITWLDTVDWRVYRGRGALAFVREGARRALEWHRGDAVRSQALAGAQPPAFAAALPPGAFRDELAGVASVRRLFPLATVTSDTTVFCVVDREGKTRVRLAIHRDVVTALDSALGDPANDAAHALPLRLEVRPVRGYDKARRKLEDLLATRFDLRPYDPAPLADLVDHLPRSPVGYSHRIAHHLAPTMRADEAARAIHLRLLQRIENTRDGARRHLDPTFVKDLRVAVRRTRVALGQIRGVFPPDVLASFNAEFRWLGKATGPARDLDVYLGRMPTYTAWLPPHVRPDLGPLTAHLSARQASAQRTLARALASERCDRLLSEWRAFLETPPSDHPGAPNAGRPVTEVAGERIWKAYRRLFRDGSAIEPETPADALHDLRLRGKKLRYMVTFFRSLYPAARIDALLEPLESLQDILGDFQDFEVQQDTLTRFGRELLAKGSVGAETLIAMGRLVAALDARQTEARAAFPDGFAGVSSPDVVAEYRRVFRRPRPDAEESAR